MVERPIYRLINGEAIIEKDFLADEEIITIVCEGKSVVKLLATPQDLQDLAIGHIACENRGKISSISISGNTITLTGEIVPRPAEDLLTAACGSCTVGDIEIPNRIVENTVRLPISPKEIIQKMSEHQVMFRKSGGVHAAAIFSSDGELVNVREDIGRHNAFDKAVGAAISSKEHTKIIALSGRCGWELIAKSVRIGIELVICVGALSSSAELLARECGVTLVGFATTEKPYFVGPIERIVHKSED